MFSVKWWYKLHKWTSIICVIFFFMLLFTGLLLLFRSEIYALFGGTEFSSVKSISQATREELWEEATKGLEEAREKSQGVLLQSILLSQSEGKIYYRFTRDPQNDKHIKRQNTVQVIYYPFSPKEDKFEIRLWDKNADIPFVQSFMKFMHVLHVHLGLGPLGRNFLGFMCGVALFCLISGLILYPRFMKRVFFAKTRDINPRLTWFNWHKFTGILTFSWAIILTVTGIFIAVFGGSQSHYEEQIAQAIPKEELKIKVETKAENIQNIIHFLEEKYPGQEVLSLYFSPKKNYSLAYINEGADKVPSVRQAVYLVPHGDDFSAYTEKVPLDVKFIRLMYNLHLNNHDHYALKIIWAFLDILTMYMVATGFIAWRKKYSKERLNVKSKTNVIPFQTKKDMWQKPIIITILGICGMVLPLYGSDGEFFGLIAWIVMLLLAIKEWRDVNLVE